MLGEMKVSGQKIIQHVNVMVDNLEEGVAFYRDVVGIELDDTPDHDFPSQFFKFANGTQIHMNEFSDGKPFRAHFCIVVDDFNDVFRRMKKADVIDIEPWGKVRRLDSGAMQMFSRDPSGNLVEIASRPGDIIDLDILNDDLVHISDDNQLYQSGRNDHRRGS
jgi:lactoylglutathione lyase